VEFEVGKTFGYFSLAGMEIELSEKLTDFYIRLGTAILPSDRNDTLPQKVLESKAAFIVC
jgi:hypothetical protein